VTNVNFSEDSVSKVIDTQIGGTMTFQSRIRV